MDWVDAPPKPRNTQKWKALANDLKANPGQWAHIDTVTEHRQANAIRNSLKFHDITVTTHTTDGTTSVYAAYQPTTTP